MDKPSCIIRAASRDDIETLTHIIRQSFRDVADRFGLTEENCPKHPSNCRASWIQDAFGKGIRCFILESDKTACGCVSLEQAGKGIWYLERLAVLPAYRRHGHGRSLIRNALQEAKAGKASQVDIGIIAEHMELKRWYREIGFLEGQTATFAHLPFTVLFMSMPLEQTASG
jgi:N-acetylglutamate synthase-like GNAT family acetyltransferase